MEPHRIPPPGEQRKREKPCKERVARELAVEAGSHKTTAIFLTLKTSSSFKCNWSIIFHYVLCLVAHSCPTLCDPVDCSPLGSSVPGDSPSKNTEVGCHSLPQGIFPTQGLSQGLLQCRWILYQLTYQGTHVYYKVLHFIIKNCRVFTRLLKMLDTDNNTLMRLWGLGGEDGRVSNGFEEDIDKDKTKR